MNALMEKKKPHLPLHLFPRLLLLLAVTGGVCGTFGGLWLGASGLAPQPTLPALLPAEVSLTPSPTPSAAPTPEPTPTPYDYTLPAPETPAVEDEWFQDAVFVGDSRTDGLRLYGGVKQGDFICYKGLTTFEFDNKPVIKSDSGTITPLDALHTKQYGKVYLMLGLNELGYPTSEFAAGFETLLTQVAEAQPNATIYIQSVVPVNEQKAREKNQGSYITNEKVAEFNAEIARLTEEKKLVLLNVSEGLVDETGQLPYDHTTDGVHFTRDWYSQWYSYLKTHTVDPQRLEASS